MILSTEKRSRLLKLMVTSLCLMVRRSKLPDAVILRRLVGVLLELTTFVSQLVCS